MGIFGSAKKKMDDSSLDIPSDIEAIRKMVSQPTNVRMSQVRKPEESESPVWKSEPEWQEPSPRKWKQEPQQEVAQPAYAPLFVKIDRYRNIISSLGSIKAAMGLVKNSFSALSELDKARVQTMGLIRDALEKIEKKMDSLDNELVRPTGFNTLSAPEEYQDVHNVQATVADLKGQIQQLKGELQRM